MGSQVLIFFRSLPTASPAPAPAAPVIIRSPAPPAPAPLPAPTPATVPPAELMQIMNQLEALHRTDLKRQFKIQFISMSSTHIYIFLNILYICIYSSDNVYTSYIITYILSANRTSVGGVLRNSAARCSASRTSALRTLPICKERTRIRAKRRI